MLCGLLMPAMNQLRENAHRLICSSNQRTIGQSIHSYAKDNAEKLPESKVLIDTFMPQELMASRRANQNAAWDGLGLLFAQGYCTVPDCFYCPSHHGQHPLDRYADQWSQDVFIPDTNVYTNFHYAGHVDWDKHTRRSLDEGEDLVLTTDGLRTASDFNHYNGMNVLRGDGSVRFRENMEKIIALLPVTEEAVKPADEWIELWDIIEAQE